MHCIVWLGLNLFFFVPSNGCQKRGREALTALAAVETDLDVAVC